MLTFRSRSSRGAHEVAYEAVLRNDLTLTTSILRSIHLLSSRDISDSSMRGSTGQTVKVCLSLIANIIVACDDRPMATQDEYAMFFHQLAGLGVSFYKRPGSA